jgi:predicted DCC family thiol-disulfide oxidoreductase YuxK
MIPFFLSAWAITAIFLTVGYRCQFAAISNYIFWLIFVNFTPMQRDFDGGFDIFMIGAGFFLLFLPIDRTFSIDNLRKKLSIQIFSSLKPLPTQTTIIAYQIPVAICLGFLYFDSATHKLFAEHWRNGLGAWLPSTMPYYISAIDLSWLLNIEWLQKFIGYLILIFQFTFIFLVNNRHFRPIFFIIGAGLHLGITLSFNIYSFGIGMLIFYFLLVPFSFWKQLKQKITFITPQLTVFYDELCPLCNKTAITISHFDICSAIELKGLQTHAHTTPAFNDINKESLLTDLYALDNKNILFSGLDTYIKILYKMRYPFFLGLILSLPGIYHIATFIYRKIADNRLRQACGEHCIPNHLVKYNFPSWHDNLFDSYAKSHPRKFSRQLAKTLILIFFLQLNSTFHYGILYRLNFDFNQNQPSKLLNSVSNSLLMLSQTFLGITPHALYMHDHFEGYNKILAITYLDKNGVERWLPFINKQGRILAPNWGRVHSMWANIAVTPKINKSRLEKFIMKVTAFWGSKLDIDLSDTTFLIKQKIIVVPNYWQHDLRKNNLQGNWHDIGSAKWLDDQINIQINYDIN